MSTKGWERYARLTISKDSLRCTSESQAHLILKSRGIGRSEFLLRYIAWRCLSGKSYTKYDSRVFFIVGPRIDLAEDLIARFRGLFGRKFLSNDRTQSTVAYLNGVRVEAFPSHHVDTMRGLTDVKFILSDESSYYPPFQQRDVRAVMEGYIGKPNSDPQIVLVSTPKAPGDLMQQIDLEEDSLYYNLGSIIIMVWKALIPSIQRNKYDRLDYPLNGPGNMSYSLLV
jgi:hypothetical protein